MGNFGTVALFLFLILIGLVFPPIGVVILGWMALSCIVNR